MRLRTFTAPTMPAAMKLVREALGEDAVIIASESAAGRKEVRVTAAIDEADEFGVAPLVAATTAKKPSSGNALADDLRYEIQQILRFHNLPELFIAKMMRKAIEVDLGAVSALHRVSANRDPLHLHKMGLEALLAGFFTFEPLASERTLMLAGPPGIGKTLTIAKLAAKLAMAKQPLAVITTDNTRAGGIEQLQAFTDILGLKLHVADGPDHLLKLLHSLHGQRVLIDTAGCNPYDDADLRELKSLADMPGLEPVLVLPAGGDSLEAVDIAEAFTCLPIQRLLLTRADTAQRFGGVLAAAAAHDLHFCQVSTSPGIINALHPLDAPLLAELLMKYQHRTKP